MEFHNFFSSFQRGVGIGGKRLQKVTANSSRVNSLAPLDYLISRLSYIPTYLVLLLGTGIVGDADRLAKSPTRTHFPPSGYFCQMAISRQSRHRCLAMSTSPLAKWKILPSVQWGPYGAQNSPTVKNRQLPKLQ